MDQTASVDSAGTIHYKANDHPEAQKTTLAGGLECGCSSGVEHNLAKVGVVGSNPIARSNFLSLTQDLVPLSLTQKHREFRLSRLVADAVYVC